MFDQALNVCIYMTIGFVLLLLCFWYGATKVLMQHDYLE